MADRGDREKIVASKAEAEAEAIDEKEVSEKAIERKAGMKSTGNKYSMFGTKADKADAGGGKKVLSTLVPRKKVSRQGCNSIIGMMKLISKSL